MLNGDFNGDGELTISDAVMLARLLAEDSTLTEDEIIKLMLANPDQDGDGLLTIMDLAVILRKLDPDYQ